MINLKLKYKEIIKALKSEQPFQPDIALILGSGLGDFADSINRVKTICTEQLPGYPLSTVHGHKGKIHFAEHEGKKLLLFQGRIHLYEGYPISQCILPVFISQQLGCRNIFLTNAAGGISSKLTPGSLMLDTAFNASAVKKELARLTGITSVDVRNSFIDLPSAELTEIIKNAAIQEEIALHEGLYWYTKGPSYETPAEIRMMKNFGADAVGMSTVHEAAFAAYLGMKAAAISCITNYAAGISQLKLSHEEVTVTANMVKSTFERLIKRIIRLL